MERFNFTRRWTEIWGRVFFYCAKVVIFFILFLFTCKKQSISIPEPPRGGEFTLHSVNGKVSLSDYSGKLILLYFGFLSCPDVCPNTLQLYASVFEELKKQDLEKLEFFFIDVDPQRDDIKNAQEYVNFFSKKFLALSGKEDEVKQVAKQYGASFHKVPISSSMGYTIDHTTNVFALNSEGKILGVIFHGLSKADVKKKIEEFLQKL